MKLSCNLIEYKSRKKPLVATADYCKAVVDFADAHYGVAREECSCYGSVKSYIATVMDCILTDADLGSLEDNAYVRIGDALYYLGNSRIIDYN